MLTTQIHLTDPELVILDGRVSPAAQVLVDAAKERLDMAEHLSWLPKPLAGLIADIRTHALKEGRLSYSSEYVTDCRICGRKSEYALHKRTTRYHRKGEKDYDKPIRFPAIDFARGFVRISGYISLGACKDCVELAKPHLLSVLSEVKAEIPEALMGAKPKWVRVNKMLCKGCGWTGHELEMGELPTLMGDGYYRGKCPKCPAENRIFQTIIDPVKATPEDPGWVVVKNPEVL